MKYDPSLNEDLPTEILHASKMIEEYAIKHGWKDWCLYGIADRKLVEKQCAIIKSAQQLLGNSPL